jgi:hypothetical protein
LKVIGFFKTNITDSRVWKTTKSIENFKATKSLEDYKIRRSARVRKSVRVKEGCKVSRSQNLKSLED